MCYNTSGILISTYTYMLIVACGLQYSACDMRFRESRKRKHQLGMRAETPGGEPSKPFRRDCERQLQATVSQLGHCIKQRSA